METAHGRERILESIRAQQPGDAYGHSGRGAFGNPLPDQIDLGGAEWRLAERHTTAHGGSALDLMDQVAVIGIRWLDPLETRHFVAVHIHQVGEAVLGIEP